MRPGRVRHVDDDGRPRRKGGVAVSVSAEALAGPVIGEVPGSLGGVRALADS